MLFSLKSTSSRIKLEDGLRTELLEIEGQVWKIVSIVNWREKIPEFYFRNVITAVITQQIKPLKIYKTGKQRTISLIDFGNHRCVLKSYHSSQSLLKKTKRLLHGTSARSEFNRSLEVKLAGVLTPTPYCYLEPLTLIGKQEGFLVLEEISESCDLKSLTQNIFGSRARVIARELGNLIANIQNQGMHHRDLHAENFLWQDQTKSLFLLDLQGTNKLPKLSIAQINQQLGQLFYSLGREVSHALRWEFWQTYQTQLNNGNLKSTQDIKSEFKHSLKSTRIYTQQSLERGDRKWERGNRRLRIIQSHQRHTRAHYIIPLDVQQIIHRDTEVLFTDVETITPIKMSDQKQIAIVQSKLFKQPVFIKHEELSYLKSFFSGWGKYSPARHAWEIGHAFNRRKIPTPLPMLMRESHQHRRYSGTIITEALPQAIALSAFLDTYLPQMKTAKAHTWLKTYLSRIGIGIARIHQGKFDHRDLKSNNILVEHDAGLTGFWIIDLDAVRKWPFMLPYRRRTQNIARLAADLVKCSVLSQSLLLRGLKSYLKEFVPDASPKTWKKFWKDISKQLSSIQERKIGRESSPIKARKAA